MKRIGEKLHALRQRHGLTTRQLADELQTSHTQISRIENGLRQPSGDLILKISQFFNVPLDKLMQDELDLD
jgi:transcriptional regulator with XRE-family HTH domain